MVGHGFLEGGQRWGTSIGTLHIGDVCTGKSARVGAKEKWLEDRSTKKKWMEIKTLVVFEF